MDKAKLFLAIILLTGFVFIFGCGEEEKSVPREEVVIDQVEKDDETAEVARLLPEGYIGGSMRTFVGLQSFPMLEELDGEDPLNLASGAKGAVGAYTLLTKHTDSGEVKIAKDHVFVIKYPERQPGNPDNMENDVASGGDDVSPARKAFERYIDFFSRKKEGYSIVGLFNEPIRILIYKEGKLDSIIYQHDNYLFGAWNLQDTTKREAMIKVLIDNIKKADSASN